jgi:hypothetical protein
VVEEKAHSVEEAMMGRGREGGMASGGSSPSREVQQILSHDKDGKFKGKFLKLKFWGELRAGLKELKISKIFDIILST